MIGKVMWFPALRFPWRRSAAGDPRPFRHPGHPADGRGVLLLHGFTGTPFEMHLLGADLQRRGFPCEAPLLAGHNALIAELARSRWTDWAASAEAALLDLHGRLLEVSPEPRIAVVGLSMGGLLALELCRRHAALVRAVVVLAAPLWLKPSHMRGIRKLAASRLSRLSLPKLFGSDVSDRAMSACNPTSAAMPIAALGSLLDLMDHVGGGLQEVRQPALLAYARNDHTVPLACQDELRRRLGTPAADVHTLVLPRSYHLVTLDVDREVLFEAIAGHLRTYLSLPDPPSTD